MNLDEELSLTLWSDFTAFTSFTLSSCKMWVFFVCVLFCCVDGKLVLKNLPGGPGGPGGPSMMPVGTSPLSVVTTRSPLSPRSPWIDVDVQFSCCFIVQLLQIKCLTTENDRILALRVKVFTEMAFESKGRYFGHLWHFLWGDWSIRTQNRIFPSSPTRRGNCTHKTVAYVLMFPASIEQHIFSTHFTP